MRARKEFMVITFHTTHDALALEELCHTRHLPGRLIPVPGEISAGCGLAWRMLPEEYETYKESLTAAGILFQDVQPVRMYG